MNPLFSLIKESPYYLPRLPLSQKQVVKTCEVALKVMVLIASAAIILAVTRTKKVYEISEYELWKKKFHKDTESPLPFPGGKSTGVPDSYFEMLLRAMKEGLQRDRISFEVPRCGSFDLHERYKCTKFLHDLGLWSHQCPHLKVLDCSGLKLAADQYLSLLKCYERPLGLTVITFPAVSALDQVQRENFETLVIDSIERIVKANMSKDCSLCSISRLIIPCEGISSLTYRRLDDLSRRYSRIYSGDMVAEKPA